MSDVRDILDIEVPTSNEITRESIITGDKRIKHKNDNKAPKRPEGMNREVYALLCKDNNTDLPPVFPTDTGKGYKQVKANLGLKKVRSWKWTTFTNPARTDGAVFNHWRRTTDVENEYPFAKFNKKVPIPSYTNLDYVQHLHSNEWSKEETDHLFDLCKRFDLRFIVIHDRWDRTKYAARSVDELKNRYYQVCAALSKAQNQNEKVYNFNLEHECKRKEQLKKLFERTPEQIEEEKMLVTEMKKIELRKRERDRKTQDLQKLITAADNQNEPKKNDVKTLKKTSSSTKHKLNRSDSSNIVKLPVCEPTGIKFSDIKSSGVSLRSLRMKLPNSVGSKKLKAIEQTIIEMKLDFHPPPTEIISQQFNELRSDIVLHHGLKGALNSCVYELQSLKHQYEALAPGKTLVIPPILQVESDQETEMDVTEVSSSSNVVNVL